jgi:2-polyprenyl-6-methoxyphenol hydroxylase-like FAD-dependent oxidoreductase
MTTVGIVGAGISGLQLALRLQQLGASATVYSGQSVDQLRSGRPRNFPARFGQTRQREQMLGVADWDFADAQVHRWVVTAQTGEDAVRFLADLDPPSSVVDFRVYLPHLLTEFINRGGDVLFAVPEIEQVAARHELVVVANGERSMRHLFPVDEARSPYSTAQRVLCSGLYFGITEEVPHSLDLYLLPFGEILRLPFFSPAGRADVLAFEAVPSGPLEGVSHIDPTVNPPAFYREVVRLVTQYAPALRERINPRDLVLIGPGEVAQGGIRPVVRRGWAQVTKDRCAMAIGDAWITNDPLTAQGANLGSRSAFTLAELIATSEPPFDAEFCRAASARLWEYARYVVEWSNAFLRPPPPHVAELLLAAAEDKQVADAFVSTFNDPVAMWSTLRDEAGAAAFLARVQAKGQAPMLTTHA